MKVTMPDGHEFELTVMEGSVKMMTVMTEIPCVWRAEAVIPVQKLSGSFTREYLGFGTSLSEAIADCYRKLDADGELRDSRIPCDSCGKGYRVLSVVNSYLPHAEICPAMSDTGER